MIYHAVILVINGTRCIQRRGNIYEKNIYTATFQLLGFNSWVGINIMLGLERKFLEKNYFAQGLKRGYI